MGLLQCSLLSVHNYGYPYPHVPLYSFTFPQIITNGPYIMEKLFHIGSGRNKCPKKFLTAWMSGSGVFQIDNGPWDFLNKLSNWFFGVSGGRCGSNRGGKWNYFPVVFNISLTKSIFLTPYPCNIVGKCVATPKLQRHFKPSGWQIVKWKPL